MKKILTFLTASSMSLFILPISVFASDADLVISFIQDGINVEEKNR